MNFKARMKSSIQLIFILAASSLSINNMASANESEHKGNAAKIKVQEIDLYHGAKQRPIKLDLWYQEQTCKGQTCNQGAMQRPNIAILSHGAMGSAKDYSWLAYPLAAKGWIVVGLNHFGESWRYGRQNIDPSSVMRFWQRTEDVSYVMDSFAEILPEGLAASNPNIVVIGHSSGGYTAASLAGVTLDAKQIYDYCTSDRAKGDLGCSYGDEKGSAPPPALSVSSGLDKRVKGIVMLDPALGPASTKGSLSKVDLPTLVIGSKNNDFLPFDYHAKYFAQHIPSAKLIALDGGEGHFVYINVCDNNYKARGVSLCQDREGVNRTAVQQRMVGDILSFLTEKS